MSDDEVETRIVTLEGEISFQEYFVRQRWQPEVKRVFYAGVERSRSRQACLKLFTTLQKSSFAPAIP